MSFDVDLLPWAEERTRGSWAVRDETEGTWTSFRPMRDDANDCRSVG